MSKMAVFWDAAPCSTEVIDLRFRGAYCLHLQGDHPYYRSISATLRDATFQKTVIFTLATVRILNTTQAG
jgi:hypothetical protein